jgi:hypothetical protein
MSAFILYLCFPVKVAALRWAAYPSKESDFRINSEWEQTGEPNPSKVKDKEKEEENEKEMKGAICIF